MTSNLETLLQNLESARLNATQGPWQNIPNPMRSDGVFIRDENSKGILAYQETFGDGEFIVSSANHILQLIEIIRVQNEALDYAEIHKNADRSWTLRKIKESLAKVEEISGKK